MNRIFGTSLALLLAVWLTSCEGDPASTLAITSIEVNQGTQTSSNTVALVAERSTTVRVLLETGSSNAIGNVAGLLSVTVDGAFITPVGGIQAINEPITVPASPDRDSEDDSLYFELEAPTGISESSDVDFFVVVAGNAQVVQGEALDLSFVETTPPTVFYVPVDYTPSGLGLPDPALIDPGIGDAFVKGIYPVNDSDPDLYQQLLAPGVGFSGDADGDGILNCVDNDGDGDREDCSDPDDLISGLASVLGLVILFGGAGNDDFIYGWLAGNPIAGNGLGQVGGSVAYGNTQESRHQRTFAHELGHNFGLNHNSRALDQTGWDTAARLDGNPAANNTTGRVKNTGLFDVMVGGRLTANAWVDTTTYTFLLGSPLLASLALETQQEAARDVLVVQGRFDPEGETLEKMEPAFRFPWTREPSRERAGDPFVAEVVDDEGTVYRRSFNALVAGDGEMEEERYGFFEVRVPVPPERRVLGLRIRDANNPERVYFSSSASETPVITVTQPQPGASLGESTEVRWRVDDPDTEAAAMQFQIAYSFDGGESWVPLLVDVPGGETSAVVNTREVQRSDGQGVIRVFVSDGLNTDFDDVNGLSTPRAIY